MCSVIHLIISGSKFNLKHILIVTNQPFNERDFNLEAISAHLSLTTLLMEVLCSLGSPNCCNSLCNALWSQLCLTVEVTIKLMQDMHARISKSVSANSKLKKRKNNKLRVPNFESANNFSAFSIYNENARVSRLFHFTLYCRNSLRWEDLFVPAPQSASTIST